MSLALSLLAASAGCAVPDPENERAFFSEIGEYWCTCAQRNWPEVYATADWSTTAQCAETYTEIALFESAGGACRYDAESAGDCLATFRVANISCAWEQNITVYADGVPFEAQPDCTAAWSCAGQ